jgi:hypothetical protein
MLHSAAAKLYPLLVPCVAKPVTAYASGSFAGILLATCPTLSALQVHLREPLKLYDAAQICCCKCGGVGNHLQHILPFICLC